MSRILLLCLTLLAAGCGGETTAPTPTLPAEAAAGRRVFQAHCATCHAVTADTIVVGPSLYGVATRAANRVAGEDAYTYLLTSILRPDAYVVSGFENLMPSTLGKTLTGEELDAVLAYLQTLP